MNKIKRNVLLNPGPATTTDSVKVAQLVPDICPREEEFANIMRNMRNDLIQIVHGCPKVYSTVLFCGSGTLVMDVCLNSLLPENKKIAIINNGAYSARAIDICKYYSLPYIALDFPYDQIPDLDRIDEVLSENKDIALVYSTHHETGTGLLNPIREIGALAHAYDCLHIVDTISTYAMIPINIEEDNIDFCMASAQKGLMAMTGLSFIVGKKELIEKSKDYPQRSFYANLYRQYSHFEEKGEMHFTPPVQTVYATQQAIKEYFAEGEKAKWERHLRVFKLIYKGLEKLGFKGIINKDWQAGLVVAVKCPDDVNWNFKEIHDYCYERNFTIYPGKIDKLNTFRLCSLGAIDIEDIEDFFIVFIDALKSSGVNIPIQYKE